MSEFNPKRFATLPKASEHSQAEYQQALQEAAVEIDEIELPENYPRSSKKEFKQAMQAREADDEARDIKDVFDLAQEEMRENRLQAVAEAERRAQIEAEIAQDVELRRMLLIAQGIAGLRAKDVVDEGDESIIKDKEDNLMRLLDEYTSENSAEDANRRLAVADYIVEATTTEPVEITPPEPKDPEPQPTPEPAPTPEPSPEPSPKEPAPEPEPTPPTAEKEQEVKEFGPFNATMTIQQATQAAISSMEKHDNRQALIAHYDKLTDAMTQLTNYHLAENTSGWSEPGVAIARFETPVRKQYERKLAKLPNKKPKEEAKEPASQPAVETPLASQPTPSPEAAPRPQETEPERWQDRARQRIGLVVGRVASSPLWTAAKDRLQRLFEQDEYGLAPEDGQAFEAALHEVRSSETAEALDSAQTQARQVVNDIAEKRGWKNHSVLDDAVDKAVRDAREQLGV